MNLTLIIDGHNLAFRAYYLIKSKSDKPIEECKDDVIFVFLNSFMSYYKMGNFDSVIFAWDHKTDEHFETETNFRKEVSDYKENRDHSNDAVIFTFIDEIIVILNALGCQNILPKSLEADDIIYYICKNHSGKKFVVSSDKDLLQIVDENTSIYSPNKKIIYNEENFHRLVGMTPEQFVVYKAILGDQSDNIMGIPRYGTKKSTKLATMDNYQELLDSDQLAILEKNLNTKILRVMFVKT